MLRRQSQSTRAKLDRELDRELRRVVYDMAGGVCFWCGRTGRRSETVPHHLHRKATHPALTWKVLNCVNVHSYGCHANCHAHTEAVEVRLKKINGFRWRFYRDNQSNHGDMPVTVSEMRETLRELRSMKGEQERAAEWR